MRKLFINYWKRGHYNVFVSMLRDSKIFKLKEIL
nr:MAG TPA: hypothetical protein [Caudoviricetes sp.]DAV81558.1 MAG TPA: hypothetical protein [Caudoviricetes sp.]